MPRATWTGFISFGLVNIPVALYSGEKRADLEFHLLDARDNARVRYQRVNEETGEEVPWDQIIRAYEYREGNYVLMGEEDFERAAVEESKSMAVDVFVDQGSIEPYHFEKPYLVVPQKGGEKAYVLLREAMRTTETVGIARAVIRGRQYLIALMPERNAIIADRLRFNQELTDTTNLDLPTGALHEYNISAQELDMAEKLVEAMENEWQPESYRDEYRDILLDWIEKKARTGDMIPAEEEMPGVEGQEQQVNITELLQRSLEEARNK